jgi:hypothetical protein
MGFLCIKVKGGGQLAPFNLLAGGGMRVYKREDIFPNLKQAWLRMRGQQYQKDPNHRL